MNFRSPLFAGLCLLGFSASAQQLQTFIPISGSSFRGLDVLNDSVWWVSGQHNTVMSTYDAGKTWHTMSVGDTAFHTDYRDIQVIDRNTVIAMGITRPAVIYKTTDSGQSWKKVYENQDTVAFLDAIDFWDSRHGICLADPVNGDWTILQTADGGDSWQLMPKELLPEAQPAEAAFAAGGSPIRVFGKKEIVFVTGGAENSRVVFSKDRGRHWNYLFPMIASSATSGLFSGDKNQSGELVLVGGNFNLPNNNASNLAIIGGSKRLPSVTLFDENVPGGYRCSVKHWKNNIMIATGDAGTDISLDGGHSWKPVSSEGFYAVDCSDNGCILSGKKGKIGRITFAE
ncbi:MAG: YCF48-related protein [Bacteroidota bacterium]